MFNGRRRRRLRVPSSPRGRVAPTPRRAPEALAVGRELVCSHRLAATQAQLLLDGRRVDDHISWRLRRGVDHDLDARVDVAAAPQERDDVAITHNAPSFGDELRKCSRPDGIAHARGTKRDADGAPAPLSVYVVVPFRSRRGRQGRARVPTMRHDAVIAAPSTARA